MAYNDKPTSYNIKDKYKADKVKYKDKNALVDFYYRLFLNKTQAMFEWTNLPDTIQQRDMELLLQTVGYGIFVKNHDKYFVLYGTLGGLWNQNYMPTRAILANHYLPDVTGSYKIFYGAEEYEHVPDNLESKGDCVVIYNDPMYKGIDDIINIYANRLADTCISRRVVTVMSRYINVFLAKDNNAYQNVCSFLEKVEKGELAAILDESKIPTFEEGNVYSLPMAANAGSARMLTELVECEQYDKASLYNELGLNANYNMKREAINADESQLNEDALLPLVDIMLESRKLACERINKLFGLNISVDFSSVWKLKRDEIENSIKAQEAQNEPREEQPNQLGKGDDYDSDNSVGGSDGDINGGSGGNGEQSPDVGDNSD